MFKTITPVDNTILLERDYDSNKIEQTITNSIIAQKSWSKLEVEERVSLLQNFVKEFLSKEEIIKEELTRQIGRPISQTISELKGFKERADHMLSIASKKLSNIALNRGDNFDNYIVRKALGVAFIIAPWNYPYLTSVNSIIPAMAAGNTIVLKHSAQTPLCAEQLFAAAKKHYLKMFLIIYI